MEKTDAFYENRKRVVWIDLLRITAVFLMMMIHVSALKYYEIPTMTYEWQAMNVYNKVAGVSVPLFIMISGVFILDPTKAFSSKKFFTKNLVRIITALVFWATSYATVHYIFSLATNRRPAPEANRMLIGNVFTGHYHLWFLYMLIGLYLIVPFLRKICEDRKLMLYFIALSFILNITTKIVWSNDLANEIQNAIIAKSAFYFPLGYAGYFVLGNYLYRFPLHKTLKNIVYVIGASVTLLHVIAVGMLSWQKGEPANVTMGGSFSLVVLFEGMALFLLFQHRVSNIKLSSKAIRVVAYVSKLTFGMYLVHDFVNILLYKFLKLTAVSFNTGIAVPILTLLVFVISLAITAVINKIPVLNRYII